MVRDWCLGPISMYAAVSKRKRPVKHGVRCFIRVLDSKMNCSLVKRPVKS